MLRCCSQQGREGPALRRCPLNHMRTAPAVALASSLAGKPVLSVCCCVFAGFILPQHPPRCPTRWLCVWVIPGGLSTPVCSPEGRSVGGLALLLQHLRLSYQLSPLSARGSAIPPSPISPSAAAWRLRQPRPSPTWTRIGSQVPLLATEHLLQDSQRAPPARLHHLSHHAVSAALAAPAGSVAIKTSWKSPSLPQRGPPGQPSFRFAACSSPLNSRTRAGVLRAGQ